MAMPEFTMRQLLEAGVHFGHHTRRWNPKMREYIFGVRNGVHIIDLQQTTPLLNDALKAMRDIVAKGGRVLFVGTKRQAAEKTAEAAKRCGQYYVNHRWLGGMMTNWQTITKSIARLRELDTLLASPELRGKRTKKELLVLSRERDKLELTIGGIKDMSGQPDAIFIIDTSKEDIAILEANKLGIPVFAIVDTNSSPDGVDFIIPGNDDALRAIDFYCNIFADAVLDGLKAEMAAAPVKGDAGEALEVNVKLPKKIEEKEDGMTPGDKAKLAVETKGKKKDAKASEAKADEKADEPANEAEDDATDSKKTASA